MSKGIHEQFVVSTDEAGLKQIHDEVFELGLEAAGDYARHVIPVLIAELRQRDARLPVELTDPIHRALHHLVDAIPEHSGYVAARDEGIACIKLIEEHRQRNAHDSRTPEQIERNIAERQWRLEWAQYFEARAKHSEDNARAQEPNKENVGCWLNKAAGERECGILLRGHETIAELYEAIGQREPVA